MAAPSQSCGLLLWQSNCAQHPILRALNMSEAPTWAQGRPPATGPWPGEGGPDGRVFAEGRRGGRAGAVAPLVGPTAARDATSGGGEGQLDR